MSSSYSRNLLKAAEKLLKELPDENNIPPDTPHHAFGLAAYLYIRAFELECRKLKTQNEKPDDRTPL